MSPFNDAALSVIAARESEFYKAARPKSDGPRKAKFRIVWDFDGTTEATVVVNRRAGTFEVRPLRRRASYALPLAEVAQLVAERIVRAAALAKRKARKAVRR